MEFVVIGSCWCVLRGAWGGDHITYEYIVQEYKKQITAVSLHVTDAEYSYL